ncbi:MAG TPA: OsmC family peroxiredoxin [Cytophagaceae bacterium]
MITKSANASWKGNFINGKGTFSVQSGTIKDAPYDVAKRFGNEKGANPEELIAAAHATCYSMALAADLIKAGYAPETINTVDKVNLEKKDNGFEIVKIEVVCEAQVNNITEQEFLKIAEETKKTCPVSKALKAVPFELSAKLLSAGAVS